MYIYLCVSITIRETRLAQSVERLSFNQVVVGLIPPSGDNILTIRILTPCFLCDLGHGENAFAMHVDQSATAVNHSLYLMWHWRDYALMQWFTFASQEWKWDENLWPVQLWIWRREDDVEWHIYVLKSKKKQKKS